MVTPSHQDTWNPDQYTRFRAERTRPFFDLLGLVQKRPGGRLVDLGCGTGELTVEAHRRLEARETLGVDSSAAMLEKSDAHAYRGVTFAQADLRDLADQTAQHGQWDIVLSNAALQWVPDQATVIGGLTQLLAPGGQIAIQVPANEDHVSHLVADRVAREPQFAEALGEYVRRFSNLRPEEYATLLDRLGYRDQHVRLQVYVHHLPSKVDVIEWVRGALLTDYQRRLTPELFDLFLARYRATLLPQLHDGRPFLYPFKRMLIWGLR